ncbi:MAG: squalene/phytoene synthase family protein [Candidatus Micrarchaeia archaeon]
MNKELSLSWNILPNVSRSFALAIKVLPHPLSQQMMVSYLIYRVIDTIEDSSAPVSIKKQLFDQFIDSLEMKKFDEEKISSCKTEMLALLDYTYEKELLENLPAVAKVYYGEPKKVRESILRWGRVMASGMYEFQTKSIRTFKDQDRYSYYVAGVVGYLFNDLLYYNNIITPRTRRKLHTYAKKFGLALQKVNILRDVSSDIPSRRYYWPREIMQRYGLDYDTLLKEENRAMAMSVLNEEIDNALEYLYSGMHYIISLPTNAIKVRMFCLIPLFMAIESYVKCIDNKDVFDMGKKVKINRMQVHEIVAKCALWGASNEKLVGWFLQTMQKADSNLGRNARARALMLQMQAERR